MGQEVERESRLRRSIADATVNLCGSYIGSGNETMRAIPPRYDPFGNLSRSAGVARLTRGDGLAGTIYEGARLVISIHRQLPVGDPQRNGYLDEIYSFYADRTQYTCTPGEEIILGSSSLEEIPQERSGDPSSKDLLDLFAGLSRSIPA